MKKLEIVEQLAQDVIMMASLGGMPDTYWLHDTRIARACAVLDWSPIAARQWANKERANW